MDVIASRPVPMINEKDTLTEVQTLADFLDASIRLPFGWRIGWDGIIGLIPGLGDFATNLLSFYIVFKAALLGCPLSIVTRMGLNILIDNLLDAIPILGNFLDFAWKSNCKNVALLNQYLQNPHRTTRVSRAVVLSVILMMALVVCGVVILTFIFARALWGLFQNAW